MTNVSDTGDHATKWMRWIARIWGSLIIVFSLIMLTGYAWNWVTTGKADPYAVEGYPPSENLLPSGYVPERRWAGYCLALGGIGRGN